MSGSESGERKPKPKQTDEDNPPIGMIGFRRTDMGNAERFVARWRGQVRYCHGRKKWLVWDKVRWSWDDNGRVRRLAKIVVREIYTEAGACSDDDDRRALAKHAHASEKAGALASMLLLAQDEKGVPVSLEELDADPWLLNCENGTINLKTGKLREHRREDLITKLCPCEFHLDAEHQTWQRFLDDSTQGDQELQRYIQRAAGYAIQGEPTERALFFVYGPPGSAKSTLIDALGAALGDYHVSSGRETWLVQANTGGNRGDLVRLAGTRLVTATEFRRGDRFDEGLIKAISGGDAIVHAAKYESEVTIRPTFTLFFAANAAPIIRDDDAGMWARMRRIPFDHAIPLEKQDKSVKATLTQDAAARSAVLAWAVRGCLDWNKSGIGDAIAVTKSNEAYRAEMDPIGGFFQLLKFSTELQMAAGAFRKAYKTWCDDNGVRFMLDRSEIEARLKAHGARYIVLHGKQFVKGVDMLGDYENPQPTLYPEWSENTQ